jgi:hypothetical protein
VSIARFPACRYWGEGIHVWRSVDVGGYTVQYHGFTVHVEGGRFGEVDGRHHRGFGEVHHRSSG